MVLDLLARKDDRVVTSNQAIATSAVSATDTVKLRRRAQKKTKKPNANRAPSTTKTKRTATSRVTTAYATNVMNGRMLRAAVMVKHAVRRGCC